MSRPQSKFVCVNPNDPAGAAQCDRCGHWFNLRDLTWQMEWGGVTLYNKRILVCTVGNRCYDLPQEQLRTIILPPDPPPLKNPRVPDFAYEQQTVILMQFGGPNEPPWGAGPELVMSDQTGEIPFILQPTTNPPTQPIFTLDSSLLDGTDVLG